MSIPTLFFSNRRLLFLANNLISSTNKADFIGQYDESSERAIMPSSYYFPPRSAVFEGKTYSVPAKLEDYLKYFLWFGLYGITTNRKKSHSSTNKT